MAPPVRNIKFRFWKLKMPESAGIGFGELIGMGTKKAQRTQVVDQEYFQLLEMERKSSGVVCCDVTHIRMNEGATVGSLTGAERLVHLEEHEGLSEKTAFLFDEKLEVLLVQQNRHGVSESKLVAFFEGVGDLSDQIELEPILTREAMQRLMDMKRSTKMIAKIAGPINVAAMKDPDAMAVSEFVELAEALEAPQLLIEASVGRASGSRNLSDRVFKIVRALFRANNMGHARVTKLEVTGRDAENVKTVVDLIAQQMTCEEKLELDRYRQIPFAARRAALIRGFKSQRSEISEMFG